ncbi:MAG TPA: hypothetical protein VG056_12335 [Pirellulales bacterium]|jgi:hypothetical protein|nr:hypothetical protein [Pirellulales bacterium]
MKTIPMSMALTILVLLTATSSRPAQADEGDVAFHFKNTLDQGVGVWVASEKSTKANPWAHLDVAAGESGTITLRAQDRFVVAVDIGNSRSRSKPIALKEFLTKHPDFVLNVSIAQTFGKAFGAPDDGGGGGGGIPEFYFSAPPKAKDQSENPKDADASAAQDSLDFGFETNPLNGDNGNR